MDELLAMEVDAALKNSIVGDGSSEMVLDVFLTDWDSDE